MNEFFKFRNYLYQRSTELILIKSHNASTKKHLREQINTYNIELWRRPQPEEGIPKTLCVNIEFFSVQEERDAQFELYSKELARLQAKQVKSRFFRRFFKWFFNHCF